MPKETRSFYALRDAATGELARLQADDYYSLVRDTDCPIFEAGSTDTLAMVLFEDTPGYNTNPRLPGWGDFRRATLEPVQVTVTTEVERVELPRTLKVETVSLRDIPYIIARKYAGGDFDQLPNRPGLIFWLVELPEGETVETVRAQWVGQSVFGGDRHTRRHVYACTPVPEDYADLLKGKNGALLVASGSFYLDT